MTYAEENLVPGEVVLYQGKLSKWLYMPSLMLMAISVLILGYGVVIPGTGFTPAGGIIFLLSILKAIGAYIRRSSTELAVTNKRIIGKVGFIKRSSIDVSLDRVESIIVQQGVFGRLLDFGEIGVRGSGGTLDAMNDFDSPMLLRENFMRAIDSRSTQKLPN